ncbi:type II toxin-antitoxin system ParD family antitoxin [Methylobacterium sp. E-045]|uniref:type II toxin-antitoxin system ParD family antitoxin n=1 Tax=Methylobacterium sp. E-045 TaxID=2836575 RepID=UPI001FBB90D9|nr:type II toxin-antitoxin system ParD family antitoxin [Methylobacterium sp. E-045]MCJ2129047.1 type II toxin-antitoxin system ParD family antitoxin [Methylobacterium sp. E-045]
MAVRETITVSGAPEPHGFLGERVHSGRCGSVSGEVRAALRMLEQSEPDVPLDKKSRFLAADLKAR